MKSKGKTAKSGNKPNKQLQNLALSVGDFIRYWGFRRIHGAIWTQLYLSKTPLSCTDLTHKLGLSKALISPALDELVEYRLIREAPAPNDKSKVFVAAEDINSVIRHVLMTREKTMLRQINENFTALRNSKVDPDHINLERLEALENMILSANLMLEIMLAQKDLMQLPQELEK